MVAISVSSAEQVVPAQEILAKLASNKPVYYDGVRISGDLDLATLPGARVSETFALVNCTIPNASFSGVTFAKDAVFWGTSFGNASFEKASFLGQADFAKPFPALAFPPPPSARRPSSRVFSSGIA